MSPTEKLYRKEFAKELLKIAEEDLITAQALATHLEVRPENTLFHINQSAETIVPKWAS